jgi:Uma2 family endonuclease
MPASQVLTPPVPAPALDDGDTLYEVINGQRVECPPRGARASDLSSNLSGFLWSFARAQRLGRVEAEMLFLLDSEVDLQRRPDVAFVSSERWPRHQPVPDVAAWPVVPNLTAEVVSPTNTAEQVLAKVRDYFRTGVQLVWVVYPEDESVYVYTSRTAVRILDRTAELDGGDVLPGFRLALEELFEQPAEQADNGASSSASGR